MKTLLWCSGRKLVLSLFLLAGAVEVGCATVAAVDADNDGVPDSRDKCPGTAQVQRVDPKWKYAVVVDEARLSPTPRSYPVDATGCEQDTDGDGVTDSQDYCAEDTAEALTAGVASNGCPKQSDGDGTPDYRDKCPDTPRGVATDVHGCPK